MDQENQPVKYRIRLGLATFLIVLAGLFDILEIILDLALSGAGGFIKDFAQIVFFPAVFFLLKAPFWKGKKRGKKIVAMITSFLVALIPGVSTIMPEILIGVALTIFLTRKEDIENNIVAKIKKSKITRSRRVREKIR